jgi:hypothetical protein
MRLSVEADRLEERSFLEDRLGFQAAPSAPTNE